MLLDNMEWISDDGLLTDGQSTAKCLQLFDGQEDVLTVRLLPVIPHSMKNRNINVALETKYVECEEPYIVVYSQAHCSGHCNSYRQCDFKLVSSWGNNPNRAKRVRCSYQCFCTDCHSIYVTANRLQFSGKDQTKWKFCEIQLTPA